MLRGAGPTQEHRWKVSSIPALTVLMLLLGGMEAKCCQLLVNPQVSAEDMVQYKRQVRLRITPTTSLIILWPNEQYGWFPDPLWHHLLQEHMERKALPNRCQGTFSPCLSLKCTGQEMSTKRRLLAVFSLQRYRSFCHEASLTKTPGTTQTSWWEERRRSTKAAVEVQRLSNGGTISSLRLAQQQPRLIQLRERKATQMLAIVLGESEPFCL